MCKRRLRRCTLLPTAGLLFPGLRAARLDIELTGIDSGHGLDRVAVCTPGTFAAKRRPLNGVAPATPGSIVVSVDGIPPGRHAVQANHDRGGDGRLRRSLSGIPAEAIGFSRDARIRRGSSNFDDAAIDVAGPTTATRFRLRHAGP